MSHNQSRGDRTKSGQYRKIGRSSSFNQQRHLSGDFKGDGGGGGGSSSATPSISNRSSNVIQDSSHLLPATVVQNVAQLCQPPPGVSDALVTSKSVNVTPINAPAQRISQAVPRSPSSTNSSTASSAISAKAAADASSSYSLQFGSIGPGFMNGLQIPARTSSAPANLDEQKEDKACHDSLKAAHAVPTPTIPKHRLPKKDTRVLDEPNTSEAQPVSKSKRDAQVSAAPPSTQIQLQATPTSSLTNGPNPIQMGMSIPLLMGNPPMSVSGPQPPNAIQSHGLTHQGQNLNCSSQMGHQTPPQFGNMGIIMAPQFPPQQAANFTASRKTVKITHPETHGGLQRNNSDSDWWQHGTAFLKGSMPSSQTPLQVMHKAEKKYEIDKISDEEEIKQRQLKTILNKLNSQNFEKLFAQVRQVNIDNVVTLSGLVSQIFDKALTKPTFCEIYANFCFHLAAELPDFSLDNERINFRRLLLNKCQMEFERGERDEEEVKKADEEGQAKHSEEKREEKRLRERRHLLGNIRLIGELYKKKMLTERPMHECIKKLLGQYQSPDEEDVEALCELMSTIGEMMDHPKSEEYMDAYFDIMAQLSNNMKLSSRVRFMLKGLINLRKNKWQQMRKVERPKKIDEVHRDAAELGPHGDLQRNNSDSDRWQCETAFQRGLMPSSQTPLQVIHKAEKKYEIGKVSDEEEIKWRQLKAILNKLNSQNFGRLLQQVKQVNIDNVVTLSGVISQIFDKALMEPAFCEMYANFCFHLAVELPALSVENERITFKRLLLNKCQEEFERGEKEEEEANKADVEGQAKQSEEEREEKRLRARRRMLGNIRLIGELYKKRMLTERIMHECIKKLLGQYQNLDEEDVEALCKLMSTIGKMIDHPKAKEHMDAYFDIMAKLSNNMKLSSRARFMLRDSIDLRKNKWQRRSKVEWPKNINEVHRDAAQFDRPIGGVQTRS
ncbi:eukaryotic translation initiation factor 4G-like [Olea europaea subsp. europaea]|uniref:Eukaryotic translation initiation factor 4G-like n=1 Tax=Olea europaea subsp. europaea TaxID=158383 RepID=A0A8S0PRJ5_OLEEU|nr:eukaryotic translation initiation factor 4G-like [Olea europaea subsp. europaea]